MLFGIAALDLMLIGCIAWWISRKIAGSDKIFFWSGLLLKLCAGIVLGLVYHYHYGLGDTLVYFQDALSLNEVALRDFGLYAKSLATGTPPIKLMSDEPRAFFFSATVSLVNFIAGGNYWLSSLWFSLFSFVCAWYFLTQLQVLVPAMRSASIVALLFFPSVVFWSSGIIKESIAFGALCALAGVFCKVMAAKRPAWFEYVIVLVSLWLLLSLKYYWAAVFLPATLTSLLVRWLVEPRISGTAALVGCWLAIFLLSCGIASFTHPNFYLQTFLEVIRQNHDAFASISSGDNLIHFPAQVNGWIDVIVNSPWALFSGLFRPLPHEVHSFTGIVSSIENLALLVLVLFKIWRPGTPEGSGRVLLLTVMSYTVLLCIFLAMSTPNLGTLSRYRIGFLPFFVMIVLYNNPALDLKFWKRTQRV